LDLAATLLPVLGLAGVFCTGSRSALVAYVLVVAIGLAAAVPAIRIPAIVLVAIAVPIGLYNQERISDAVTRLGERINVQRSIEIDGRKEQITYTGTRFYLLKVYWPAIQRAGWLGFGTEAISTFPVKLPPGLVDPKAREEVPFIDNQFVLMTLRFGWAGVAVFTLSLLLAALAWFQRGAAMNSSHAAVSFYVGGTILAVGAGLLTVWMPHDIGFPLLWWMGAGSSTLSVRRKEVS
jgi:hypothetical protein